MANKVNKELDLRDQWFGVKLLKPFSPQVYTKHDKHGTPVTFKQQAEATAEYLSTTHWAEPQDEYYYTSTLPTTPLVPDTVEFDNSPILEEELQAILKTQKITK